jgi:hypothetical protein
MLYKTNVIPIPIHIQLDASLFCLLYLETDLHVSDGTSTHHKKRMQLYLQHLVFLTPLRPTAAIVEQLQLFRYRGSVGTLPR